MRPGIIPLAKLSDEERERVNRWATANGINPNRVPLESIIKITGTRAIVTEFIFDQRRRGGKHPRIQGTGDGIHIAKRARTYRIRHDLKDIQ